MNYDFVNTQLVIKDRKAVSVEDKKLTDNNNNDSDDSEKNENSSSSNNSQNNQQQTKAADSIIITDPLQIELNSKFSTFNIDEYNSNNGRIIYKNKAFSEDGHNAYKHNNKSVFDGFFGCIYPFLNLMSTQQSTTQKSSNQKTPDANEGFDIPFDELKNLQWIGNGAQGCVFKGQFRLEDVAIKKVKSKEEACIKNLKKLNHQNLVKFKGASFNGDKFFCIVMEFCPYGQLYTYLNSTKENFYLKPSLMIDWSKQIAAGMQHLHLNKIIHRDLKSPNILISENNVLKISDFGASKNSAEKSMVMSFKGTVAWMAPEVIRNEACSEKVDVYSFGVVLWELLMCETPYKNLDQNSIMWGVGSNKLRLPIPVTAPDGIKLLLQLCFNLKPRNRPTFSQILKHLEIVSQNEIIFKLEDEYQKNQLEWKEEIKEKMDFKKEFSSSHVKIYNLDDLVQKRKEELQHATSIRELYEQKLEKANNLYFELNTVLLQLDEREKDLLQREKALNIHNNKIVRPIVKREFKNKAQTYIQRNTEASTTTTPITKLESHSETFTKNSTGGINVTKAIPRNTNNKSNFRKLRSKSASSYYNDESSKEMKTSPFKAEKIGKFSTEKKFRTTNNTITNLSSKKLDKLMIKNLKNKLSLKDTVKLSLSAINAKKHHFVRNNSIKKQKSIRYQEKLRTIFKYMLINMNEEIKKVNETYPRKFQFKGDNKCQ